MAASTEGTIAPASAARDENGRRPPRLSGGWPFLGHLLELRRDPLALMRRLRDECGEIGEFRLVGDRVVLLSGVEAQEAFFRAPDEQLDQAAAYPFMKPIFGEGVVFDASPEQRKQAMRNQSLRDQFMRGHAEVIATEVDRMTAGWGDAGRDRPAGLLRRAHALHLERVLDRPRSSATSSAPKFADLFHGARDAAPTRFAYVNPYLPLPALRSRDRARRDLVAKIEAIFERRASDSAKYTDLFHVLHGLRDEDGKRRFSDDQITGMFISMMFAGHHTTSRSSLRGALIDLLRNPEWLAKGSTTSSTRSTPTGAT